MNRILIRYIPGIRQDDDMWIAECTDLKLMASGYSAQEAVDRLRDSVRAFCTALKERGLLHKALVESGIDFSILCSAVDEKEVLILE